MVERTGCSNCGRLLAAFAAFCTGDAIGGRGDICFWLGVRTAARRVLAWMWEELKRSLKKLERNFEKGVDFRQKCGIINKLSRKTAALQEPNKSDVPAKTRQNRTACRWKAFKKAFGRLKKISKKVLDKKYDL